jgi:hypothetical protein
MSQEYRDDDRRGRGINTGMMIMEGGERVLKGEKGGEGENGNWAREKGKDKDGKGQRGG